MPGASVRCLAPVRVDESAVPGQGAASGLNVHPARGVPAIAGDPGQPRGRVRRIVYLGEVAEYEVETGPVTLFVPVANPVAEGLFGEGDAVSIALPAHLVALVPAS